MRKLIFSRRSLGLLLAASIVLGSSLSAAPPEEGRPNANGSPDRQAVRRAHETVKMLDDLHKNYVVQITSTYVKAQERTPAAHVAKKVFEQMEKNGWGSVRLIDAPGKPINKANVAKTDFEKNAINQLNEGKSYVSEVSKKSEQSVLRAATPVPVVMKQCINCHAGYKEGELLGALVYEIPIK